MKTSQNTVIAVFKSTHDAIKSERLCMEIGIPCQAIPVPRTLSAGCGIALAFNEEHKKRFEEIVAQKQIIPEYHIRNKEQ